MEREARRERARGDLTVIPVCSIIRFGRVADLYGGLAIIQVNVKSSSGSMKTMKCKMIDLAGSEAGPPRRSVTWRLCTAGLLVVSVVPSRHV